MLTDFLLYTFIYTTSNVGRPSDIEMVLTLTFCSYNSVIKMSSVIGMILFCKEGREATPDLATSPRRQAQGQGPNVGNTRPKDPPPMVVQGDFRKVNRTFTLWRSDDV